SVCVSMVNTDQVRENTAAIRSYEPMKLSSIMQLRDAIFSCNRTLCADCTGQCAKAAGTGARLDDLARLLTYYDHYGYRSEARRLYEALSAESRDWSGADLAAAEAACPNRLKFSTLLPKLDQYMA
ncbi:MAG: aldo/keto reductase, partial [Isosphaeraceae bacterium]